MIISKKKDNFINIDVRPVKTWADLSKYNDHNNRENIPINIDQEAILKDSDGKFEKRIRDRIELSAKANYLERLAKLEDEKIETIEIDVHKVIPSAPESSTTSEREEIESEYEAEKNRANETVAKFRNEKTIEGRLKLLNVDLVPCPGISKSIQGIWEKHGLPKKPQSRLVKAFLAAIQISPKVQNDPKFRGAGGCLALAKECHKFLAGRFGEANIASLHLHMDETTPHIHAIITPVVIKPVKIADCKEKVEKPRLCFREFFGQTKIVPEEIDPETGKTKTHSGRQKLRDLHTDLAKHVASFGLARGRMQQMKPERNSPPTVAGAYESQSAANSVGKAIIEDTLDSLITDTLKNSEKEFEKEMPLISKLLSSGKKQREKGLKLTKQLHSKLADDILSAAATLQSRLATQFQDAYWQKAENKRLKAELEAVQKEFLPLTCRVEQDKNGNEIKEELRPDLFKKLIEQMLSASNRLFAIQRTEKEKLSMERERKKRELEKNLLKQEQKKKDEMSHPKKKNPPKLPKQKNEPQSLDQDTGPTPDFNV